LEREPVDFRRCGANFDTADLSSKLRSIFIIPYFNILFNFALFYVYNQSVFMCIINPLDLKFNHL